MRDKYLIYLRQKEYQERVKQELENARYRNTRDVMNQEPVDEETLKLWDSQPAITFVLDNRKKVK